MCVSETAETIELFWISGGRRHSYGKLGAGESRDQHTYAGHVWEAVSAGGKTIAFFEATDESTVAIIREGLSVSLLATGTTP